MDCNRRSVGYKMKPTVGRCFKYYLAFTLPLLVSGFLLISTKDFWMVGGVILSVPTIFLLFICMCVDNE